MGMTNKNLCNSCTNIGCEPQSVIASTVCPFYMPPQLELDSCGNYGVKPIEATPQLSEADSKKIIKEVSKPNYKRVQKLEEIINKDRNRECQIDYTKHKGDKQMKLIDADKLKDTIEYSILANVPADAENTKEEKWNEWFQTVIDREQPVEAILKSDYEARLRADMLVMLIKLHQEINGEAWTREYPDASDERIVEMESVNKIIQQEIDKLKEQGDENVN